MGLRVRLAEPAAGGPAGDRGRAGGTWLRRCGRARDYGRQPDAGGRRGLEVGRRTSSRLPPRPSYPFPHDVWTASPRGSRILNQFTVGGRPAEATYVVSRAGPWGTGRA